MPEILTLVKLKQDNYEFQASLCYTVRPCLTKQNKQKKTKIQAGEYSRPRSTCALSSQWLLL
jgi:hypothetical protein